jgi:hypothetical protein
MQLLAAPAIIGTCDSFSLVPLLLPISSANQSPFDQVNSRCLLDTDAAGTRHASQFADHSSTSSCSCHGHLQSFTANEFPVFNLPTLMGLLLS